MEREKIQKYLVDSANREIKEKLKKYCQKEIKSLSYYDAISKNLDTGVIRVPNPQIWVCDDYVTNSTTFSMMNLARDPFSYKALTVSQVVPRDEENFGENMMGATSEPIFYERYLADCSNILHKIASYYPTDTIEVHDFGLAMFTFWVKSTYSLLRGVQDHHKKFFTQRMFNQFIHSLVYDKNEPAPNINLYLYDVVGTIAQCSYWKKTTFINRFKPNSSFATVCSYDSYEAYFTDILTALRSARALLSAYSLFPITYFEVRGFDNEVFKNINNIMCGTINSTNERIYDAIQMLWKNIPMKEVMKFLKKELSEKSYTSVKSHTKENADRDYITYQKEFRENNLKIMRNKGVEFKSYGLNPDEDLPTLLPPATILSEVVVDMDAFRREYPSCSEKQFIDVYLMAHTINSCKRTFAKNYKREDWDLCVKVISGSKKFEFEKALQETTTKIRSDEMENYIARIV